MKPRRILTRIKEPEQWRRYKDTNLYISDQGRAKKIYHGVEYELGHWSQHESKRVNVVKVGTQNHPIKNLVWETFKGEIPDGYCVTHKGLKRDDSIYNLECIPRTEHGHRIGLHGNSQKVADLDRKVIYRSASEAARKLHCSRQVVCYICRGERKKPMFNLAWWDEENEKAYRGEWNEGIAH